MLARILTVLTLALAFASSALAQPVQTVRGTVTFLRVHAEGTGYGPPNDHLDAEVIVKLSGHEGKAYGLKLRGHDGDFQVRRAMFELLKLSFEHELPATLDVLPVGPNKHLYVHRVWLER